MEQLDYFVGRARALIRRPNWEPIGSSAVRRCAQVASRFSLIDWSPSGWLLAPQTLWSNNKWRDEQVRSACNRWRGLARAGSRRVARIGGMRVLAACLRVRA